jgi:hypothetical protein
MRISRALGLAAASVTLALGTTLVAAGPACAATPANCSGVVQKKTTYTYRGSDEYVKVESWTAWRKVASNKYSFTYTVSTWSNDGAATQRSGTETCIVGAL